MNNGYFKQTAKKTEDRNKSSKNGPKKLQQTQKIKESVQRHVHIEMYKSFEK